MCEFHLLIVVETYEVYELATQAELKPERVGEGFLGEFSSACGPGTCSRVFLGKL